MTLANAAICACAILAATLAVGVVAYAILRTRVRRAVRSLLKLLPKDMTEPRRGATVNDLETCIVEVRARFDSLEHRAALRHPVTGLETREVLLKALSSATQGTQVLAVISLTDFDALVAFDIDAADQVLNTVAQRLVRMMPATRLLAQIDRASFGILFEPNVAATVSGELDAIAYALNGRILSASVDYLPKVAFDHVCAKAPVSRPGAVVSRLLAGVIAEKPACKGNDFEARVDLFALEQDLRQAVSRHQLELRYQPVVDAQAGKLCSVEALLRWRHPEHGLVPPSAFIPIMERTGLSEEIGNWVLDRAARDAAAWARAGHAQVKVAVNLSAHQLTRIDLDQVVERILARHGLPPAMVELELTETAAAVDPAAARALFARLRTRGITIVIDDFGAGFANLSYLKKLDFDKLKIDREFVTDVDTDRHAQAICRSIMALAEGLGLTVLAEGVERPEEYEWLRRQGCALFQGYYFAKPLRYDELLDFATDRQSLLGKLSLAPVSQVSQIGALAA
jgi:EAL domain-containing protein (putative c-di-GMP-specific phosphodiesterase class I)